MNESCAEGNVTFSAVLVCSVQRKQKFIPILGNKHDLSRQLMFPHALPLPGLLSVSDIAPFQGRQQLVLLSCSPLAIDLFELVAFVAVAVALGIAIVIAGRGSAALLGRLRCRRLPGTARRQELTQAPALWAQVLTSAGQVVSTRSHSTLSLLGTQCCSLHISVLPCSLEKY